MQLEHASLRPDTKHRLDHSFSRANRNQTMCNYAQDAWGRRIDSYVTGGIDSYVTEFAPTWEFALTEFCSYFFCSYIF